MLYWIFGLECCQIAKFCTKIRILEFGTKNVLFGCFGAILENYCPFCNQRSGICPIAKVGAETKILKFGTKNVSFGYVWDIILKYYCHI